MKLLKSPTGTWNGKPRVAIMIAKNIHQPAAHVTKQHAPAAWKVVEVASALWHTTHDWERLTTKTFPATAALPAKSAANSQYATVNKMKANVRAKKMTTKQILTRNEQMRKMKLIRPMKSMMKPYPTDILLALGTLSSP